MLFKKMMIIKVRFMVPWEEGKGLQLERRVRRGLGSVFSVLYLDPDAGFKVLTL